MHRAAVPARRRRAGRRGCGNRLAGAARGALIAGADHAGGIPDSVAAHRIDSADARGARAHVAAGAGVDLAAVAAGSRSRRNAGAISGTLIRVGCRRDAEFVPSERAATKRVCVADAGRTRGAIAARTRVLTAAVAPERWSRGLGICSPDSGAEDQQTQRGSTKHPSLRDRSHGRLPLLTP